MSNIKKTPPPIPPKPKKTVPVPPPMPTNEQLYRDTASEVAKNIAAAKSKNNSLGKNSKSNLSRSKSDHENELFAAIKRQRSFVKDEGPEATYGAKQEVKVETPKPVAPKNIQPIKKDANGIPLPPPPPPKVINTPKPTITITKSKSDNSIKNQRNASFVNELSQKLGRRSSSKSVSDIENFINSNKQSINTVNFKSNLKRTSIGNNSVNTPNVDNSSELQKAFNKMKSKRRDSGIDLNK